MMRLLVALALSLLAGCSLLVNTGLEGHPCDDNGACLSGYACNSSNICVKASELACSPMCPATEVCINKQCVDKCSAEACAPGSTCTNGACEKITSTAMLGSSCQQDTDCGGNSLVCLVPYGGLSGVCTATCSPGTPQNCTSSGEICQSFASDGPTGSTPLCADPSLKPCSRDSDCSATPGFVCGVGHVDTPEGTLSASFCIPSSGTGASPGATCVNGVSNACANGLCVLGNDGSSMPYYCTEPCSAPSDCTGFVNNTMQLNCKYVTLTEGAGNSGRTHAQVCIEGASTFGLGCTSGSDCTADAPNCVEAANNSGNICAPLCSNATAAQVQCEQSPQSMGSLTCNNAGQCH